jgi:hypothetical protein
MLSDAELSKIRPGSREWRYLPSWEEARRCIELDGNVWPTEEDLRRICPGTSKWRALPGWAAERCIELHGGKWPEEC